MNDIKELFWNITESLRDQGTVQRIENEIFAPKAVYFTMIWEEQEYDVAIKHSDWRERNLYESIAT